MQNTSSEVFRWIESRASKDKVLFLKEEGERKELITEWSPFLLRKRRDTQCTTWIHLCVDQRSWHIMPARRKVLLYLHAKQHYLPASVCSNKYRRKQKETTALARVGRRDGQIHASNRRNYTLHCITSLESYMPPLLQASYQEPKVLLKKNSNENIAGKLFCFLPWTKT